MHFLYNIVVIIMILVELFTMLCMRCCEFVPLPHGRVSLVVAGTASILFHDSRLHEPLLLDLVDDAAPLHAAPLFFL